MQLNDSQGRLSNTNGANLFTLVTEIHAVSASPHLPICDQTALT